MSESELYLIIEFDWPEPITKELASTVRNFHDIIKSEDWIQATVAASGGIGGDYSSLWVFEIQNYATLDKFFHGTNPVTENFPKWADLMTKMKISVKEKVKFL